MDLRIHSTWQEAVGRLEARFREEGFQVDRSFDLQLAREGLRDPAACPCPHHGTSRCTCQYLVYQLYGEGPEPITVVVHGHDNQTFLSIEKEQNGREQELWSRIGRMFIPSRNSGGPTREEED